MPCLYFTADSRWLLCSNVDTQRLFDEEIDGLGFQLKEWPWHWGREQLLIDLCQNRKLAVDRLPLPPGRVEGDFVVVADRLQQLRLTLTDYERACLAAIGQT